MLAAVEIIIARMKSHIDEFSYNINTSSRSRWFSLIEQYRDCLTEEENAAVDAAVKEMRRELFTQDVYKVLTGSGEPEWDEVHPSQFYGSSLAKSLVDTKLTIVSGLTDASSVFTPEARSPVVMKTKDRYSI